MASGDVVAELGYLQKLDLYSHEKPFQIFIPIEDDHRQTNLEFEPRPQNIVDIRPDIENFRLDTNGFEVRRLPTAVNYDLFQDQNEIKSRYLPEIEEELKFIDGGYDRVFFFDWRVRTSDLSKHDRENKVVDINAHEAWLDPVTRVHVGMSRVFTKIFSPAHFSVSLHLYVLTLEKTRVQDLSYIEYSSSSAKMLRSFYKEGAWRPLENSVHEWPLALCDPRSMPQEDLVECDHVRRRFKGTAFYAYYNPDHKWYYLGDQTPDEVTFLKIFDSDPSVPATRCPHSSFQHPNSPDNCLPRQSIEVRALVFNYPQGIVPPKTTDGTRKVASSPSEVES